MDLEKLLFIGDFMKCKEDNMFCMFNDVLIQLIVKKWINLCDVLCIVYNCIELYEMLISKC